MEIHIKKFLEMADSKALASYGSQTINVVPVSTIKIVDDEIWLIDYFMEKTVKNIIENEDVALVAWKDLFGYQLKCKTEYEVAGDKFNKAVEFVKEILPDRKVKGLLVLKIQEVYDIAPTKNTKEHFNL